MLVCVGIGTYVSPVPTKVSTKPTQSIQCGAHITLEKSRTLTWVEPHKVKIVSR